MLVQVIQWITTGITRIGYVFIHLEMREYFKKKVKRADAVLKNAQKFPYIPVLCTYSSYGL
jgi:triosephosphate isomerase